MNLTQLKNFIKIKNLPATFERYEIFVMTGGVIVVFLLAGWVFYNKAYKTVTAPRRDAASIALPNMNKVLLDKTLQEIEQKKQPPSSEPIVDPFR